MTCVTRKNLQIVSLATLLVACLFAIWLPWQRQVHAAASALAARQLSAAEDARQIAIQGRNGFSVELQQQAGQWLMTRPLQAVALPARVDFLLALLQLPATHGYDIDETDDSISGLDEPVYTVRIDQHEFLFGNFIDETHQRYFQHQHRVWLIPDVIVPMLNGGPQTLIKPAT